MSTPEKQEKYPVSPDLTHLNNVVFETIIVRNNIPYYQKWLFRREDFPCGRCNTTENTVFMITPSGVCRSCTYCGFTEHVLPVHPETGDEFAYMIEERAISTDEAWTILRKHKVRHAPAGLAEQKGGRKRRLPEDEK
jgi:hypothetical protein